MPMLTKAPPKLSTTAATSLEDHPGYVAALAKQRELTDQKNALEKQLTQYHFERHNDRSGSTDLQKEAADLLAGRTGEQAEKLNVPHVERQITVLETALRLHQPIVDREKRNAQIAVRQALKPTHQAMAGRIKQAITELHQALLAELAFRDKLARENIDWGTPLVCAAFPCLGDDFYFVKEWLSTMPADYPKK